MDRPVHDPSVTVNFEIRLPASEDSQASYDQIYSQEGIQQLDSFYLWLLQLLDPVAGRHLLDIAGGAGALNKFAREYYHVRAVDCDISLNALRRAATAHPGFLGSVADGERLPFPTDSFDYVTCIGSLEHFPDMRRGVQEIARVLKTDGLACILVPNTYSLLGNVYSAYKHGASIIDNQPLQRYAARAEWEWLLRGNGLAVERTVKYERERPLTLTDVRWYWAHKKALIRLLLSPLVPLNLASCFVFLCRPIAPDV